jgi:Ca2+-binding RTX toxin-like protein
MVNPISGGNTVNGTAGNDNVHISKASGLAGLLGLYEVNVNGNTQVMTKQQLENTNFQLGAGNDTLVVDSNVTADITANGGSGNDVMIGGGGDDKLKGGSGNDVIAGRGGNDCIDGGSGSDSLSGAIGADRVYGQAGNDHLNGGSNTDMLDGGSGNDTLNAAFGGDHLYGRSGRDYLNIATAGRPARADCGTGRDKVRANYNERRRTKGCEVRYILRDRPGFLKRNRKR